MQDKTHDIIILYNKRIICRLPLTVEQPVAVMHTSHRGQTLNVGYAPAPWCSVHCHRGSSTQPQARLMAVRAAAAAGASPASLAALRMPDWRLLGCQRDAGLPAQARSSLGAEPRPAGEQSSEGSPIARGRRLSDGQHPPSSALGL